LEEDGYNCITVATGEDALKKLPMGNVDVVLLDLRLPGMSGMDVLREIKSTYPRTAVIVVTGVGDAETVVEAMKTGAVDYITKPFAVERVSHSVEVALQKATIWGNKLDTQREGVETSGREVDWARCIDAIAEGVETRLDSLTGHVMTIAVIEETIGIARSMDIPEDQIEKWADTRRQHIKRVNILDSLLEKADRAPLPRVRKA
jgi:CheY-like chemotaxis protein